MVVKFPHMLNSLISIPSCPYKLKLTLSADLNNLTDLSPSDPDTYNYFFKVQCSGCREVHQNWIGISKNEERSISGSHGTANFIYKCQLCSKEASAAFVKSKKDPEPIYHQDSEPIALCVLDCRGCELIEFDPRGQWTCKGAETKSVFSDIEFEDGEWQLSVKYSPDPLNGPILISLGDGCLSSDYDEAAGLPVSITNIKTYIERA